MATIPVVNVFKTAAGEKTITPLTATPSDSFAYKPGVHQALFINNITAGALTPNINGGGTTYPASGLGAVDISVGQTLASIGAGEYRVVPLDQWKGYLSDATTVTGADGAQIWLIED